MWKSTDTNNNSARYFQQHRCAVLRIRSGIRCLFDPGSGIRNRFFPDPGSLIPDPGSLIPDPGSQTHTFDSLMTNCWVTSTIARSVLGKKISVPFKKKLLTILWYLWLQKMEGRNFFFLFLFLCCCWIRNPRSELQGPRSGMDKNQDLG